MKKTIILLITLISIILITPYTSNASVLMDGDKNLYFGYESQLDESYYSSLNGLSGDSFRAELNDIITENFVWYTYDSKNRYEILPQADAVYGQEGMVYCIYSGQIFKDVDSTNNNGGTYLWNTEHVWAKSHGFADPNMLPYSDYHHLRVACKNTNSRRNNRFIGSVEGLDYKTDEWGNKYTEDTWEPRDSVKGDVARMLLYMDVRYDGEEDTEIDLVLLDDYDFPDKAGDPYMSNLSDLLLWHEEDEVDDRERSRNDVIYSYQKNRNPFIDKPEYVDMIWGDGVDKELEQVVNFDNFINLIEDIDVDSQQELAIGFVLYNKLNDSQKELVTTYPLLLSYYETYKALCGYTDRELAIIFAYYEDYKFLDDILNGNIYDLEGFL